MHGDDFNGTVESLMKFFSRIQSKHLNLAVLGTHAHVLSAFIQAYLIYLHATYIELLSDVPLHVQQIHFAVMPNARGPRRSRGG